MTLNIIAAAPNHGGSVDKIAADQEGRPLATDAFGEWTRPNAGSEFIDGDGNVWVATAGGWVPADEADVHCYGERT